MGLLLLGGLLLALGELFLAPSFVSFVLPMWVISAGIVLSMAVTANGALAAFGDKAGTAVALYSCIQSLIVVVACTAIVLLLNNETASPMSSYCTASAAVTLIALRRSC
jgi:DHA1 family florfenicol/chloramphenicol resistance protein-like MFS transporter